MRDMNRAVVLKSVRNAGPMSRADIARATGLSKPTVTNVVEDLNGLGFIRLLNGSGGGHRRPLCEFSADLHKVLGVDIGGYEVRVSLANLDGQILASTRQHSGTTGTRRPEQVPRTVKELAEGLLARACSHGLARQRASYSRSALAHRQWSAPTIWNSSVGTRSRDTRRPAHDSGPV